MTSEAVTAVDLARRLNVDPKRLRGWLRENARAGNPILRGHQHRDAWVFTRDEADALAKEFNGKRSTRAAAVPSASSASLVAAILAGSQAGGETAAAAHPSMAVARPFSAEAVETLTSTLPAPASTLVRADLPAQSGLYAWWLPPNVLPGLQRDPAQATSIQEDLALLYIGISGDLQARIWRNHLNGNTGSSTLRRTLAALLTPTLGLATTWSSSRDRVVLTEVSEEALSQWIRANLSLTWATHPAPKEVEGDVIRRMKPPCNLDHNSGHPNYAAISSARAAWRASVGRG